MWNFPFLKLSTGRSATWRDFPPYHFIANGVFQLPLVALGQSLTNYKQLRTSSYEIS